jgi:hypothetical protein
MKGGGYYSRRTRGAKDAIDGASGMLMEAVAALPAPNPGQPVRVADFGAADGGTSKKAMHDTVAAIRARFPQSQVVVTYTDLPSNDYSALFKNMLGLAEEPELSYLTKLTGVFVHACGVGFHRQLFPDASLDLGFSATAMHYLSEKPCEITTHVHMVGANGEERAAFARRAEADWINILLARARELRPGGRLVFLNFGIDEQGRYLGHTGEANMFDTYDRLWRALRDEGRITAEEYVRATFAQFYRTKEEFAAPMLPGGIAYQAGLRLLSARTGLVKCPYRRAFEDAKGAMSAKEFAASYVPTLRSWSETVFANALDPARPADERAHIVDDFYRSYEDVVAADPHRHGMDYVHCYLAIEKVG